MHTFPVLLWSLQFLVTLTCTTADRRFMGVAGCWAGLRCCCSHCQKSNKQGTPSVKPNGSGVLRSSVALLTRALPSLRRHPHQPTMPGRHNASSIAGGALSSCLAPRRRCHGMVSVTAATHKPCRTTRAGIFGETPIEIPKINVTTVGQHNTSSVQGGAFMRSQLSAVSLSPSLQPQKRLALTRAAACDVVQASSARRRSRSRRRAPRR